MIPSLDWTPIFLEKQQEIAINNYFEVRNVELANKTEQQKPTFSNRKFDTLQTVNTKLNRDAITASDRVTITCEDGP